MKRISWLLLIAVSLLALGCGGPPKDEATDKKDPDCCETGSTEPKKEDTAKKEEETKSTPPTGNEKVKIEDIKVGTGPAAANGDLILVTYTGKLTDGKMFDSNDKPEGDPFSLILGNGMVIKGWEDGLLGMKKGGERKLNIPYMLAYGDAGSPPAIPPKADLVFDVKLLGIVRKGEEGVFDKKDIKPGAGEAVKKGDRVSVHYTGKLLNGKKFDSSRDRGTPFEFTVGNGEVISGWDAGIIGMKKGGVRQLIIPPAIAYGAQGSGTIGPNQVLDFEIELMKINGK